MASKVTNAAKKLYRSRNSITNEAVEEWLDRHGSSEWPKGFFSFEPISDIPDFREFRMDLINNVSEDPFV